MPKIIIKNPFIITKDPIINNTLVTTEFIELSNANVYYSKNTDITVYEKENFKILLIGYAFDTENSDYSTTEILIHLSNLYIQNYNLFLDKLDYLNGRYVIITDNMEDTEIYNDATALRPIFQWNKSVFASHESLLKLAVKNIMDIELEDFGINNGYLDATNTLDVYKFNPNLNYSFKNNEFSRIYPRKDYKTLDKEIIIEKLVSNFEEQVRWLEKSNKKLYFSLTGGYDSKVSLSLVKPILDKIFFFTYIRDLEKTKAGPGKEIYLKDEEIVKNLAENINLNHSTYYLKDYYPTDEFKLSIKNNVSSNHSVNVSYLMYKEFEEDSLHVKSTLYEIAKMPYPSEMDFTVDYNRLFKLSTKWQTTNFKKKVSNKKEFFENFIIRSKFKEIEQFNYNLPMMLFWESRMANWHGNITQETDHTSETFIFLNSRYILDLLLQTQFEVRDNKGLLTEIVDRKWPILQYFIPNSYRTLKDEVEERTVIELSNQYIKLTDIENLQIKAVDNKLLLMPARDSYLLDDNISLNIENTSDYDRELNIQGIYKHPKKNIFLKINNKEYSINNFYDGKVFILPKGSSISIEYKYTKNFESQSWFDAGKVTITLIES